MAWTMPAPPPGLADLLKRGGQLPPNPFGATSPQQPSPMAPSGQDAMRAAIIPQQAAPAQAPAPPPPSDDPAISGSSDLSPLPTVPQPGPKMAQYSSDVDKLGVARAQAPDPAKLRPKLLERLAGAGTAFAAGWKDPALGLQVGSNVTNRRFNQAQSDYRARVSPLEAQVASEREAAQLEGQTQGTQFTRQLDLAKESRERKVGEGRVEHMKAQNDLANQRAENLQNQIDHPKQSLPKNADEALAAASAEKDPTEKKRLIQLAADLHKQEIDRIVKSREPKEKKNTEMTPGQKASIENRKGQALQHAETNYRKAIGLLTPTDEQGKKDALDQLNQDKQAAQDNYENEISAAGGSPSHLDVNAPKSTPQATPAATPQATNAGVSPDLWKGKEGKRLIMSDGSKWELQSGKPVQVSAPTKK